MVSDDLAAVDMAEMDAWRRKNQEERYRMLDDYARWLRERGILKVEPRPARGNGRGTRRAR